MATTDTDNNPSIGQRGRGKGNNAKQRQRERERERDRDNDRNRNRNKNRPKGGNGGGAGTDTTTDKTDEAADSITTSDDKGATGYKDAQGPQYGAKPGTGLGSPISEKLAAKDPAAFYRMAMQQGGGNPYSNTAFGDFQQGRQNLWGEQYAQAMQQNPSLPFFSFVGTKGVPNLVRYNQQMVEWNKQNDAYQKWVKDQQAIDAQAPKVQAFTPPARQPLATPGPASLSLTDTGSGNPFTATGLNVQSQVNPLAKAAGQGTGEVAGFRDWLRESKPFGFNQFQGFGKQRRHNIRGQYQDWLKTQPGGGGGGGGGGVKPPKPPGPKPGLPDFTGAVDAERTAFLRMSNQKRGEWSAGKGFGGGRWNVWN